MTYDQFEMESLLEESMDCANVAGGSLNNGQSWLNFEANNGQNLSSSIDGLNDEDFPMDTLRMEPIDDATSTANGNSSDAIPHEFKSATIITQNTPEALDNM